MKYKALNTATVGGLAVKAGEIVDTNDKKLIASFEGSTTMVKTATPIAAPEPKKKGGK